MSGYRILDVADEKGMLCSKLLADLGADVIKIEKPGGDSSRNIAPFLNDVPHPNRSLCFWYYNTNKRGITLNLEIGPGRELFQRLVAKADVLLETYPPGYLEKLGLGYSTLCETNPELVMASITNFGQFGPYRDYKSSDIVASALGGAMSVCGDIATSPLKPFGSQAYHTASLFAAVGILLALWNRHFSGKGQHIDISLQECVAATLDHVLVHYFHEQAIAQRQGGLHWSGAFRVFPAKDGYILLSLFQQWETLVEWLDSEGMAEDLKEAKWQDPETRRQGLDHVVEVLERWTKIHTVAELVEQGQLMRFPWAEVASIPRLVASPQLRERGFFVAVEHPELEIRYRYPGAPYHFSSSQWRISRRAPLLGEHNREIYEQELGLYSEELARLEQAGVI